jgi:hypothetical protein
VSTHDTMCTIQENRIDLLTQANLTHILIILLLDFEDLRQLLNLLLQSSNFLLHLYLLCMAYGSIVVATLHLFLIIHLTLITRIS